MMWEVIGFPEKSDYLVGTFSGRLQYSENSLVGTRGRYNGAEGFTLWNALALHGFTVHNMRLSDSYSSSFPRS